MSEQPITPKAGEPMPDVWGDVPEFIASDQGYSGLLWMSEDYMRDGNGRIQWEKIRPDNAESLKELARNNSQRMVELSGDVTCQISRIDVAEYNPGRDLAGLVGGATHIISGSVIDYRQGFADGGNPATIYQVQPNVTFKGAPLEAPILVRLQMARIETSEGLICIGVRVPDKGLPVTGARVVMFLSDARIWGGLWHVPNAAVFYRNPDGEVSVPFGFKDVKSLDGIEERIVKEMERGAR